MSRVRGLVLEQLAGRHAVILTPRGDFVRVRLRDGAEVQPGQEIWGEEVLQEGALAAALHRVLGSWRRTVVATAVAFGAAGALFAALYLRGALPGTSGPGGVQAMPGESTVDAHAPSAAAAAVAGQVRSGPAIRLTERMDAPRLYVSTDFGEWASLRLERQAAAPEDHTDIVEYIRHALRAGSAPGSQATAAGAAPERQRAGGEGGRRQVTQAARTREAPQLALPVVRLGAEF